MIIYGRTVKGPVRVQNEDSLYIDEKKRIWAVADGMGGHTGGAVASHLAVKYVAEYFSKKIITEPENDLKKVFQTINQLIKENQKKDQNLKEMGTTLTLGIVRHNYLYIGHIGDSRAYVFRKDKLLKLTQDHTYVAKMISQGVLNEEEAQTHPYRHLLIKALDGAHDEVDIIKFKVQPQDMFIFCTDGLLDGLSEAEIKDIILNNFVNLEKLVEILIEKSIAQGSRDNITVVAALYDQESEVKK